MGGVSDDRTKWCPSCRDFFRASEMETCDGCHEPYCTDCDSAGIHLDTEFYCKGCAERGLVSCVRDFILAQLDYDPTQFSEILAAMTQALSTKTSHPWLDKVRDYLRDGVQDAREFDVAWAYFKQSLVPEVFDESIAKIWRQEAYTSPF